MFLRLEIVNIQNENCSLSAGFCVPYNEFRNGVVHGILIFLIYRFLFLFYLKKGKERK